MNVFIESRGVGHAIGRTEKGVRVFIKNGDLIREDKALVQQTGIKGDWLLTEVHETYQALESIADKTDKDHLVSTQLISVINPTLFKIGVKFFFPHWRTVKIIDYLFDKPDLWMASKLLLTTQRGMHAAARVFGLTFQQAVEKLRRAGIEKARLYCEEQQQFLTEGVVAEMLTSVVADDDGLITLQMWQGVENVDEVFYAHGILDRDKGKFRHFDCAIISFSIRDKELLFDNNSKVKGCQYQKLYRIDGELDPGDIYEIANRFFPLDRLIDEFFTIGRL